jgi:hypothetical protein
LKKCISNALKQYNPKKQGECSMKWLCTFVGLLLFLGSPNSSRSQYPPVPTSEELVEYILQHQQTPEDYIIAKFRDHDVVFLGERHRIRHDAELVQRLIPICYQNGVRVLALEFADRQDQPLIDSLLSLPSYDESIARLVAFRSAREWAYQEYLDIYKAAWALNMSLPKDAPKFRIVAVNCSGDWSIVRTREDIENDSLRRLVWERCPGGEREMAFAILRQVWKGEKILVYSGIHHAFTRYIQPIVNDQGNFTNFNENERMAHYVYLRLGSRVFTVFLHSPWPAARSENGYLRPVNGLIDSVMTALGDKFTPVGFDVKGSPFGLLPDSASLYQAGYADFRLQDFCDGYIYQRPFKQYEVVHFVEDFINPSNILEFCEQAGDPWFRDKTLEQCKTSLKRQLERELQIYKGL